MRTTYMAKPNEVERKWYIIDAEGKTLGRLASEVAASFAANTNHNSLHTWTLAISLLSSMLKNSLTGKKMQNKKYYRHSMYPGGLKVTTAQEMLNNKPERMIELAVHGMLPKTRLGDNMKTKT